MRLPDWSRFPLGTRFRIVGTRKEYVIDDYGTALIGTNTIDLYKPSRLEMKRWGVRKVDIDIVHWGIGRREPQSARTADETSFGPANGRGSAEKKRSIHFVDAYPGHGR